jgi:predicted ATPase/DNA-binding transcriptional LysR family regulator
MKVEPRLRAFAAVAREGSFSRAAERLYVSQPAVSKHVASLEKELGTQLIEREPRGAGLTPAGKVLAEYVLRAEALLANARRALASGAEAQIGTLSLAASGIPGTYLLPGLLSRFHEEHPAVELDFRLSTSGGAIDLVRSHEVELAVVGGMTVPPELDSEMLVEDEVVLVGPPTLGGRRLRPKDLEALTWVSREEGSATRAAVESARWLIGLHVVRRLELPSWEAVKLAVASGAGIAAISRFALDLELEAGTLAVLDVPRWRLSRTVAVVTARGVPLTPPAERFLERLRAAFQPEAATKLPANSNLPALATSIVGREQELDEVVDLVRGTARLITLTGAGGSGKTRLAVEVASRLVDDFHDGVYLVELAAIPEPGYVLPTIARVLQVKNVSDLAERLRTQRLLLVVDNLEHVIDVAPALLELLGAAPELKLLVTSRAPLRVAGECVYQVEPLALDDALTLFVERAQAVSPRFEPDESVSVVCERLDGLPLAIELAAARLRSLTARELVDRLASRLPLLTGGRRDLPARQRTLRRTLDWSYELLNEEQRRVLARLAVFAGGWTLSAAESLPGIDLETLTALVDANLVHRREDRFAMLETIQEYALGKLREAGEEKTLRDLHLAWATAFVERAAPELRGADQASWLERLHLELDNFRAALAWSVGRGDAEGALRLTGGLLEFWMVRADWNEGREWLERALALRGEVDPAVRMKALQAAGELADALSDYSASKSYFEESLAIARGLGDERGIAAALTGLAFEAHRVGRHGEARPLLEESVTILRNLGDEPSLARSLGGLAWLENDYRRARKLWSDTLTIQRRLANRENVGWTLIQVGHCSQCMGDSAGARAAYEETLSIARELGYERMIARALTQLAEVALRDGDAAGARDLFDESLLIWRKIGHRSGLVDSLRGLGDVARLEGDFAGATSLLEESLSVCREIGARSLEALALESLGALASAGQDLPAAESLLGEALAHWRATGDVDGQANALRRLGEVAVAQGEFEHAVRFLGASEALRDRVGAAIPSSERGRYEEAATAARVELGDIEFEDAWAVGRETELRGEPEVVP